MNFNFRQPFNGGQSSIVYNPLPNESKNVLPCEHNRITGMRDSLLGFKGSSDLNQVEGFNIPYDTFLKEEEKRKTYSERLLKQLHIVHIIGKCSQQLVNCLTVVSSKAVLAHFSRKDDQLIVFDIEENKSRIISTCDRDYFETDNVVFIASWKQIVIAYTLPYCEDAEAAIILIDLEKKTVTKLLPWDLTVYWTHRHLHNNNGNELTNSTFKCTVSDDGIYALIVGPSETFGNNWGCKLLNIQSNKCIQNIEIPNYKYAFCASFHPWKKLIALVCQENNCYFNTVLEKKDAAGRLVTYDFSNNKLRSVFTENKVSSDVIRFSPDGEYITARADEQGAIILLNSTTLEIVTMIEHDFGPYYHNPFMKDVLYKLFPLFSDDGKEMAMLQYKDKVSVDLNQKALVWNDGIKWITKIPVPCQFETVDVSYDENTYKKKRKM